MPFVRDNEPIRDWAEGDFAQGFALLARKEVRVDRNGREYLDLELADASGSISAKVWPENASVKGDYQARDFVAFKGTVHLYRDRLQLNVDHCRRIEPNGEQGFDADRLIPTTSEGIEPLWQRLRAIYPARLERPALARVAEIALERHGDALREHAAAKSIHHAYRGGLLEHTVTMAELALDVVGRYPDIDRDLVLLGVLFHDLGKLIELEPMPSNDYTLRGHLVGHVVIGRDLLIACCDQAGEVDETLRLHLEHLVLSHQGRRAYGSPVEPRTPEAYVLHAVDDLDSKLEQLRNARREGPDIQFLRGLDRHVYVAAPPEGADGAAGDDEAG